MSFRDTAKVALYMATVSCYFVHILLDSTEGRYTHLSSPGSMKLCIAGAVLIDMNFVARAESPGASSLSIEEVFLRFDDDMLREIRHLGLHPFILLSVGGKQRPARYIASCKTQNDAGAFANDLSSLPNFAESRLVRALERALRLETYEAAELLLI